MKLSRALDEFHILPLNQTDIVGYCRDVDPVLGEIFVITWYDGDTGENHRQEFVDQDIRPDDLEPGLFLVDAIEDGEVGFIALRPVKKEDME